MVQLTNVSALDTSVEKTNRWLKQLSEELDVDRENAYKVLRGYLQAIRECLDVTEASDFAAQLPILLRGVYYTGWNPAEAPQRLGRDGFLELFVDRGGLDPQTIDPAKAVGAVTALLRQQITEGAVTDVFAQLRRDVREVVESA